MTKAKCKKYDLSGNQIEEIEVPFGEELTANSQSIKDYIVAIRANARQWSANTKGRSENRHSGAKPHAQKGTGKARQGFLGAPQYRGGGRVGTPKPKFDQHIRINQKERRAAIGFLLAEKIKAGDVIFLSDQFEKYFQKPKTKVISSLLYSLGWAGRSVAMYGLPAQSESTTNFKLSMRNVPRTSYLMLESINGYDILANQKIIIMDSAMDVMKSVLGGHNG